MPTVVTLEEERQSLISFSRLTATIERHSRPRLPHHNRPRASQTSTPQSSNLYSLNSPLSHQYRHHGRIRARADFRNDLRDHQQVKTPPLSRKYRHPRFRDANSSQIYRFATRRNGSIRSCLVSIPLNRKMLFPNNAISSAKDQLTNQAVAVKKIMKPFSTPVLSKRTYRELKLLKHLRHENVSILDGNITRRGTNSNFRRSSVSATFSFPPSRICMHLQVEQRSYQFANQTPATSLLSCWVPTSTVFSLPGLLRNNSSNTSSTRSWLVSSMAGDRSKRLTSFTARPEIRPLRRRRPPRLEAQQHSGQRELRLEDLRLWSGSYSRSSDDRLRFDKILQSPRDHAHLAKV